MVSTSTRGSRRSATRARRSIVSFGGQKSTSLAVGCTNQVALTDAFSSVIDRYGLNTVDLDVEGTALNNFAANRRLATAMASIQQASRAPSTSPSG